MIDLNILNCGSEHTKTWIAFAARGGGRQKVFQTAKGSLFFLCNASVLPGRVRSAGVISSSFLDGPAGSKGSTTSRLLFQFWTCADDDLVSVRILSFPTADVWWRLARATWDDDTGHVNGVDAVRGPSPHGKTFRSTRHVVASLEMFFDPAYILLRRSGHHQSPFVVPCSFVFSFHRAWHGTLMRLCKPQKWPLPQ